MDERESPAGYASPVDDALLRAAGRTFDLLVVGGGVFGAGAAREAALNGWSVCLAERGDLGEETSSRSSKLLHGGLRYLERGDFSLVRESLRERAGTARLGPHLARPLPFLAPVYRGARVGPLKLRAGLFLYDLLARPPADIRRGYLDADEALRAEPRLKPEGLRGAGRYFDYQTFDSRLTAEIAVAAAHRGAKILLRTEVEDVTGGPPDLFTIALRDRRSGEGFTVRAKAVIAAVGPFSDLFRTRRNPRATREARLTSGAHVVLPAVLRSHALVLTARSDGRVFFVLPFEGRTLIGTTDRDFTGDPADPQASAEDVRYLLDEANAVFAGAPFRAEDVIASFAGVRTLALDGPEHPSSTSREQRVFEEPRGLVHIVGGKLTTWRPIARSLVEAAARTVGRPLDDGALGRTRPLPGGDDRGLSAGGASDLAEAVRLGRLLALPEPTVRRIVGRYGCRALDVLRLVETDRALGEPIGPSVPEIAAELVHLAGHEFAETSVDALRRRLPRLLIDRVLPADLAQADRRIRDARRDALRASSPG